VGVMGGSHGGSTTLASMAAPASSTGYLVAEKQRGFAAGIALYPGGGEQYGAWIPKRESTTARSPAIGDRVLRQAIEAAETVTRLP